MQIHKPDSEVGAAGVIATHWGHPAGICSDVTRPRLGDVQGPVKIQPQAWWRVHVNHRAALLPYVPGSIYSPCDRVTIRTHTHTLSNFNALSLSVVTVNPFALCQFIEWNIQGVDTDEKPDVKVFRLWEPTLSLCHTFSTQPLLYAHMEAPPPPHPHTHPHTHAHTRGSSD